MDRRAVVATKAACQTLSHLAKLIYFAHAMGGESGADEVAMGIAVVMAIAGTTLSKFVLEKLTDNQFRRWTQLIVVRSEEHTSELQSLMRISYAVFCLKKK